MTQLIDNTIRFRSLIVPLEIKIRISKADEIDTIPHAFKNTPYIIISVSDNGIGFDEENADRIFDPFFRIKSKVIYKGSGIGLAICRRIMVMHGGFITGKGNPAHGAIINCYFPLTKQL